MLDRSAWNNESGIGGVCVGRVSQLAAHRCVILGSCRSWENSGEVEPERSRHGLKPIIGQAVRSLEPSDVMAFVRLRLEPSYHLAAIHR